MKTPNPLIPQGALQKLAGGKSHVRIAVFTILAIHVVLLGALLIQGCKRDDTSKLGTENTNTLAITSEPTNEPVDPFVPAQTTTPPSAPSSPVFVPPTSIVPEPAPVLTTPAPAESEHSIARGETLSTIAKKHGVSVRAIQQANPDIQPTRLKIGQKLRIPAKAASESGQPVQASNGNGFQSYVVKSGDTLSRIASQHGTTAKAIRSANNLKTDQIRVGQKLKVPPGKPTGLPSVPGSAPATPAGGAPIPFQ